MIFWIADNAFFIVLNRNITKEEFVEAADVSEDSYARELVERMYEAFIEYGSDIKSEYQRYYAEEYIEPEEFLFWKYNTEWPTATRVAQFMRVEGYVGFIDTLSGGEYVLSSFLDTEPAQRVLDQILQKLGADYEDQDGLRNE